MKYLFYPVLSPVHRGALQIIWQPIPRDTSVAADLTNLSTNTILDMAAAQPYEITVGYNNDNPMCYTDFYAADTPFSTDDYDTLNGYLRIRSLIPFTGSLCGTQIHVLVFAAAGENMQFGTLTDEIFVQGERSVVGYDLLSAPVLQSGVVGADGQDLVKVDLIPSSGNYPVKDILMGEEINSVRVLLQKPSMIRDVEDDVMSNDEGEFIYQHWVGSSNIGSSNLVEYFGSMFLGMAGSMRYKFIADREFDPDSTGFRYRALDMVPMIGKRSVTVMSFPLAEVSPIVTDVTVATEMTVPYYYREKYIKGYGDSSRSTNTFLFRLTDSTTLQFQAQLYRSAGPDLRLTYFRMQNEWLFVTPSLDVEPTNFWTTWRPWGSPALMESEGEEMLRASKKKTQRVSRPGEESQIRALNQYRVRTGRKDFKKPHQPIVRRTIAEVKALRTPQTIQEGVVVVVVPPLKSASRRL